MRGKKVADTAVAFGVPYNFKPSVITSFVRRDNQNYDKL